MWRRQPQQALLVLSIHAKCFARTDQPLAFQYMTLKLKINCVYIYIKLVRAHKIYKP